MASAEKQVETYFAADTGYFLLQLRKDDVGLEEEEIDYQGKTFTPKDEVHITIIGSNLSERLVEKMRDDGGLEHTLKALISRTEWSYSLLDEWYHIRREENGEEAESIIRMVEVPAVEDFYRRVEEESGLDIPPRPTHVTLYTWNDPEGIGVATYDEFRERAVSELEPELLED